MSMEVETLIAVSLMMAVFSAVAAVGTSIILGAGFERLRSGFEVIRKQTGFFSDAIQKLEQKVEVVDQQTTAFSQSMHSMEQKVSNVGEQANVFSDSMQKLEQKVEVVDKQTGFFSQAIHKLDKKIDQIDAHEKIVSEKMQNAADTDLISTGKAEALVSHAEDLLTQVSTLANRITEQNNQPQVLQDMHLSMPSGVEHKLFQGGSSQYSDSSGGNEIRYH